MLTAKQQIAQIRRIAETAPDAGEFEVFDSLAPLVAYVVVSANEAGRDGIAEADLLLSAARPSRGDLREAAATLTALGHVSTADLLRRHARRAPVRAPSFTELHAERFTVS